MRRRPTPIARRPLLAVTPKITRPQRQKWTPTSEGVIRRDRLLMSMPRSAPASRGVVGAIPVGDGPNGIAVWN